MTRRRLIAFFLLTLGISWGVPGAALLLSLLVEGVPFSLAMYSPLYYVGVWGPAIAALAIVGWTQGGKGLAAFLRRMLDWRFGWRWYAFALLGIPAIYLAAAGLHVRAGTPEAIAWYDGPWIGLLGIALARATAGPVEELGWRGFALPLLQRVVQPWTAILLLGFFHAVWHAPVFVIGRFGHFGVELPFALALGRFAAQILAFTVILAIAYNATGGSLTLAFLIHWMTNLVYPWEGPADRMTGQTILLAAVAIVMALTVGRKWLSPGRAATLVTPGAPEPDRARGPDSCGRDRPPQPGGESP